jgi:hypothetical protein
MKPINVSVRIDRPREEVFAFLDVLSNHEPFTDHMLVDWSYSGPAAGVGAKARLRANLPGLKQWADMEVIAAEAPLKIVEQAVAPDGRRRTQGTYTLDSIGMAVPTCALRWSTSRRAASSVLPHHSSARGCYEPTPERCTALPSR